MLAQNKTIADLATEIWNTGDLSKYDEIYSRDFISHDPSRPDATDYESYGALIAELHSGMPDYEVVVEDTIAENDKVVCRWTGKGTHKGVLTGFQPTGKSVSWTGITIYRFENGKIVEAWWNYDMLGALQQIGVIPSK